MMLVGHLVLICPSLFAPLQCPTCPRCPPWISCTRARPSAAGSCCWQRRRHRHCQVHQDTGRDLCVQRADMLCWYQGSVQAGSGMSVCNAQSATSDEVMILSLPPAIHAGMSCWRYLRSWFLMGVRAVKVRWRRSLHVQLSCGLRRRSWPAHP